MEASAVWIQIILPIVIVGALTGAGYLIHHKVKKFSDYYRELDEFLQSEPYNDTKTTLRTVDINLNKMEANRLEELRSNLAPGLSLEATAAHDSELLQIQKDKEEFADNLNEIEDKIQELKYKHRTGTNLLKNRNYFKMQHNWFEIQKIKFQVNKLANDVEKRVKIYIDEIEEIQKILYKYRNQLKNLIIVIHSWKTPEVSLLNTQIEHKLDAIQEINNNLSDSWAKRKIRESKTHFYQYKKELYQLYRFANHRDQFYQVIFTDAPAALAQLQQLFKVIQTHFGHELIYLEITKYFENARHALSVAQDCFGNFLVEPTQSAITNFFDILLSARLIINSEFRAYKFVTNSKTIHYLNQFYQNINKRYAIVTKEIDEALAIDLHYFEWLKAERAKMEQIIRDLEELKTRLTLEENEPNLANASKQHRMKSYFYLVRAFNEIHDNIRAEIQLFYSEGINPRLIFNRIKNLVLSLNVELKTLNVKLNSTELRLQANVEKKRVLIAQMILNHESESQIKAMIQKYQLLGTSYLKTIGKKWVLIKIYTHLNERYSYKRHQQGPFHKLVTESEQCFQTGDYDAGFKLMVHAIKSGLH